MTEDAKNDEIVVDESKIAPAPVRISMPDSVAFERPICSRASSAA